MDYQDEYNEMMKENFSNQQNFKYIIVAVVAFVLGFGAAWLSFKNQNSVLTDGKDSDKVEIVVKTNDEKITDDTKTKANKPIEVSASDFSLKVSNQAPGKTVFVDDVKSDRTVWVVIMENFNGVKGNILGAGLFEEGQNAGLVELLRGTVEGGSYYALIYAEDSNLTQDRVFNTDFDLPLVASNGGLVEVMFQTSSTPEGE